MNVVYELIGVDKASDAIKKVEGSFGSLQKSWAKLAGALAAGGSVAYLTNLVKQSLDAADALAKMSQQTGVSVETLSSLKLAAQLSGTDIGALAGGINKMQKAMVEAAGGNRELAMTFKALGVDINGGTKEALYAVADSLSRLPDGAQKSALAMQVFGKSGAALIPFLNQGAEGLQKMEELSEKLGLTITGTTAKGAERFNDSLTILGMQAKGFGNMLMTSLMPTLEGISKALFDGAGQGGAMRIAVDALTYTFKGFLSVGVVVWGYLKSLGSLIAGVVAAVVQMGQGNFSGAWSALKMGVEDSDQAFVNMRTTLDQLWTDSLPKTDEGTRKAALALGNLGQQSKEAEDALKRLQKEAEAFANETDKLLQSSAAYVQQLTLEIAAGEKLSEAQKKMLAIGEYLRENAGKLVAAEIEYWQAQINTIDALNKRAQADAARKKHQDDILRAEQALLSTEVSSLKSIRDAVAAQEKANATMGLTRQQLAQYNIGIQERVLLELKAKLATEGLSDATIAAINAQIEAQEKLLTLMREGASKEAAIDSANAARSAWQDAARDIEQALTNAMVQGFSGGANFLKSIGSWIVNYFKSTAASGIARALTGSMAAGLSGVANASGMQGIGSALGSAAGGGGSAVGGLMGGISGGLGAAGALGSYGATGAMFTLTGGSLSTGLGAAGSLMGGGNILGGLGMGLGTVAPYLLAAYAIYSILKGRGETRQGAQYGISGGEVVKLEGPSGGDPAAAQSIASISGANAAMQSAIAAFGGDASGINISRAGWETSKNSGKRFSEIFVNGIGRRQYGMGSNEDVAKAFAEDLQRATLLGLQQANLERPFREFFAQFDAFSLDQEQLDSIMQIAGAAREMAEAFKQLGGPFEQLADLSVAARAGILDMTGGLEQFVAKSGQYFQQFYSEEERQALSLASVAKTLGGVGLDAGGLRTTADYRALVESLDLSGETGQRQFAALMNAAGSFAFGANLLDATGMNLGELTAGAPANVGVDLMVTAQDQTNTLLGMIEKAIRETSAQVISAIGGQQIALDFTANVPGTVEVAEYRYGEN